MSQSLYGWQSVSQSVCLGVEPTLLTFDQILLPFQVFGSEICCLVSVGRLLWREAGSVLCKSQSSHLSVCTFTIYIFVFHTFTICSIYIYTHTHTHTQYTIHIIHTRPLLVPACGGRSVGIVWLRTEFFLSSSKKPVKVTFRTKNTIHNKTVFTNR
jgi:hypothetical protein